MSAIKKDIRKIKHLLTSKYGLRIFAKIYSGYKPSQIAGQLHISVQNVNYYTTILTDLRLIEKLGDRRGTSWRVTERGLFMLKQFIRGSVNSYNNNQNIPNSHFYDAKVPVRLHNVSFAFKITSSLEHLKIPWKNMKNGVSRHTVIKKNREDENTVDLIKTRSLTNSVMLVHVKEVYTFNGYKEIIRLYEDARTTAVRTTNELRIQISPTGELIKRPHLAFEADPDYGYKYLTMPENVFDLSKDIKKIESKLSGYKRCYDPIVTDNN